MRRIRAIVSGRVQGVSYRAATCTEARRLGLVGWVKNRDDGSVELEAEGPDDMVAALIQWCHQGPPAALVARVAVEDVRASGADRDFQITY
jgi:acylphosphatase